jgi:glycogen synthase
MRRMKICMTTLEFPPDTGGVGESVKRISGMLRKAGHEIHVFVFHSSRCKEEVDASQDRVDTSEQDGVFVHRYRHIDRGTKRADQDVASDAYIELQKLHERENFDLFHAFFLNETGFLTTLFSQQYSWCRYSQECIQPEDVQPVHVGVGEFQLAHFRKS